MPTSFSTIYSAALMKIKAYDLIKLFKAEREDVLHAHLLAAQMRFQKVCRADLTDRDDALGQYNQDIGEDAVEVLATGIAFEWLSACILNNDLLENEISTKEASTFSPANLIRETNLLRRQIRKEFLLLINQYDHDHSDHSNLTAAAPI